MNILALDSNPIRCARYHCDTHVNTMVKEAAQILSTTHIAVTGIQVACKAYNPNNPCVRWVRESINNYLWLYDLYVALLNEYEFRKGKSHGSRKHAEALATPPPLPVVARTPFVQVMPEEFRRECPHEAYRIYVKAKLTEWEQRTKPVDTRYTKRNRPFFLET